MTRRLVVLVTVLCTSFLLSGCSIAGTPEWDQPVMYRLKITTPRHYDVWIKSLELEASGERAWWWPGGITTCCWKSPGLSGGPQLEPMPDYIYISWFSLAEQQSYARLIHIPDPEALRERMKQPAPVHKIGKLYNLPRYNLVLGLAPGGTVVMWIMSKAETAIEVGRYKAVPFEDEKNDYSIWVEDYLKEHGEYLNQHGLQLDRW
ncbi:MAG: DUF2931 family protein [Marinobacter sp.]